MNKPRAGRRGTAPLALLVIGLITVGWWWLALWPAGSAEPEWLTRTRAVCFGNTEGGLPDLGGWILLIGQPIGMLGILIAVWGDSLKRDIGWALSRPVWRRAIIAGSLAGMVALVLIGRRVAFAAGVGVEVPADPVGLVTEADVDASAFILTDQNGRRGSVADLAGGPAILTFAFGHCGTICPTVVHSVLTGRKAANRGDIPVVVLTVDPWRDTPERLEGLARQWGLGPRDLVLSGGIREVVLTLDALGVGRKRDEITGDIDHTASVMVIDGQAHVIRRLDGGWGEIAQLIAEVPDSSTRIEPSI